MCQYPAIHSNPPLFFLYCDTGSGHLSSSGSITLGAFGPPEGLLHLWSVLSLCLTFPERAMHISLALKNLEKQTVGAQRGQRVGLRWSQKGFGALDHRAQYSRWRPVNRSVS